MKKFLILLSLGLCAGVTTHASTVIFSTELFEAGSSVFVDPSGDLLSDGSLVRIGFFGHQEALGPEMSVSDMEAAGGWLEFGVMQISSPFGYAGKLYGRVTNNSPTASAFDGLALYIWVFDAPNTEVAGATGIFRATDGEFPWIFPTNAMGVGDITVLSMDEITMSAIGGVGSVGEGAFQLVTSPIPEPSSMILGGAVIGLLATRRLWREKA